MNPAPLPACFPIHLGQCFPKPKGTISNGQLRLLYPEHAGTMLKNAPHRVIFMFGDLYTGVLCVVRQVKARFFHMFDRDNLLPQHAEVDVMLEEYIDQSVDYSEVRG